MPPHPAPGEPPPSPGTDVARCASCGVEAPGAVLGVAWPFDGRRICRSCVRLAVRVPPPWLEGASPLAATRTRSGEEKGEEEDPGGDLEASLVTALFGRPEGGRGRPLVVKGTGGRLRGRNRARLHPAAAEILRGTALFADPEPPERGGTLTERLHRVGVLRSGVAERLERRVEIAPDTPPEVRSLLGRRRPFRTEVPPEIDAEVALPPGTSTELSLAALLPWRLRLRALQAEVDRALRVRAEQVRRRRDLDDPGAGRRVFVDELGLPAAAWRDRLALLVSAADGLEPADGEEAPARRFSPVPRPGQEVEADAHRKRTVLAYLLQRLPVGTRSAAEPLRAHDVEIVHALYAPSLAPEHRGWSDLRPVTEIHPDRMVEKPEFTVALPPDVVAAGLEPGVAEEIERQVEGELGDSLLLVKTEDGRRLPVAPGSEVLADLARQNDGGAALRPRVEERLAALEDEAGGHRLCGCDACLARILRHLRALFLLMPFRRSNRRIVYNFLLTYYLLRCRARWVAEGRTPGGVDGPAVPAVHWRTSELVRSSLERQRRLVRAGQERFRRICAGEDLSLPSDT